MSDSMDPQMTPTAVPETSWTPTPHIPAPAPTPTRPTRAANSITPAIADLVHGYRKPAFMTDTNGQIVCMNAAAGRLFDTTQEQGARHNGPVTLSEWDRKATLQADGKTLYLVIPDTPGDVEPRATPAQLPPRLAKIARLVVSGCTDKQIASRTGLSFSTVRTYVRQIYRRMGVHSRVELVHATNQGQTLAMD